MKKNSRWCPDTLAALMRFVAFTFPAEGTEPKQQQPQPQPSHQHTRASKSDKCLNNGRVYRESRMSIYISTHAAHTKKDRESHFGGGIGPRHQPVGLAQFASLYATSMQITKKEKEKDSCDVAKRVFSQVAGVVMGTRWRNTKKIKI